MEPIMNKFTTHNAEIYFANLWSRARSEWVNRNVPKAEMDDGIPLPTNFCLSTVGRIKAQKISPMQPLQSILSVLQAAHPKQFLYPISTLHVTLLGCTNRSSTQEEFTDIRRDKIGDVCETVIQRSPLIRMTLKGIGVIGNQIFIQVFPQTDNWALLRMGLAKQLRLAGETPLEYPDTHPIHLNILRVTDNSPSELDSLLKFVEQNRERQLGELIVDNVDYLCTDFVLSEKNTTLLRRFQLNQNLTR